MHASKKFKKRWPCQKFRVSAASTGPAGGTKVASFASFHCSIVSTSTAQATLRATDPHISQVLFIIQVKTKELVQ